MKFEKRGPGGEPIVIDIMRGRGFVEGQDKLVGGETDLLKVVETEQMGKGLIAKEPIKSGKRIFGVQGQEERVRQDLESKVRRTKVGEEGMLSLAFNPDVNLPNAICIDQEITRDGKIFDVWLDPHEDNPLRYLNHSCDPNTKRFGAFAFFSSRDIAKDEPITIDYSTLEVNPEWRMACQCGSPDCRKEVRSVHFLTPKQIEPSWRGLPGFIKRTYLKSAETMYQSEEDREILDRLKENQEGIGFD